MQKTVFIDQNGNARLPARNPGHYNEKMVNKIKRIIGSQLINLETKMERVRAIPGVLPRGEVAGVFEVYPAEVHEPVLKGIAEHQGVTVSEDAAYRIEAYPCTCHDGDTYKMDCPACHKGFVYQVDRMERWQSGRVRWLKRKFTPYWIKGVVP